MARYKLCDKCGCPMLPKGKRKRPFEYDHATGCPSGIVVGRRVRVCPWNKAMEPHPHADKTGIVKHVHDQLLMNAVVLIDRGFDGAGRMIVVSLTCLEQI